MNQKNVLRQRSDTKIRVFTKPLVLLIFMIVLVSSRSHAIDDGAEIDHVSIAALLIKDGYYKRAESSLKNVNLDGDDYVDEGKYYFLLGLIDLKKELYKQSLSHFKKSMEQGFSDLEIHFYRADCHFKMGFLNKALSTLEKVGSENYKKISYFILKSSIYHKMGQRTMAWKTLNQAKKLNKNLIFIVKKQFSFLIEEKLYLSAYDSLKPYVRRKHFVDDIVKMSVLLRKEKQYQYAVQLLESLRIHWPKRQEIALELTQNYLKMKMVYAATSLLEEASRYNEALAVNATSMLQHLGKNYRARFVNLRVSDDAQRLRHKLAILIEENKFKQVTELYPTLVKSGLLRDESLRYALSYSYFMSGQFTKAEHQLGFLKGNRLYEKSISLRQEIQKCREQKDFCYESI